MLTLIERLRDNALIKDGEAWRRLDGGQDLSIGSSLANEAADKIEQLQSALRNVRGYIKDCDHEPAVDEIDAALGS